MKSLPKIVDLFSGCGGLSLGFRANDFNIAYGLELVPEAAKTASRNVSVKYGDSSVHVCGDITEMDPDQIPKVWGEEGCIVIGGPPCQAYSMAGRAKLSSLGIDRKNINDQRGYLFLDYLRFVDSLSPKVVVMENVIEATNYGGMNVPEIVCEHLDGKGYESKWTILNAANYGVPQVRERMILIAVKKDMGVSIDFPIPSCFSPNEKALSRSRKQEAKFSQECKHFIVAPVNEKGKPWVTVEDALGDLPPLFINERSKYNLLPMNFLLPYKGEPKNEFQKKMRSWYGRKCTRVSANVFRKTLRDFPIFARMKPGDDYVAASAIADQLFAQKMRELKISMSDVEQVEKLKKKIVPPYSRDSFTSKWQKLDPRKPSHTLVAHLSVDTYSHIHPWEPRGISVREAARLQSFPDDFSFPEDMANAYKEIGNAVPPLLSFAIAEQIRKELMT